MLPMHAVEDLLKLFRAAGLDVFVKDLDFPRQYKGRSHVPPLSASIRSANRAMVANVDFN